MKILKLVGVLVLLSMTTLSFGQNGQQLFEAKCNVCHKIDKPSTGPALQGAKARWETNSSVENFYSWIKNSTEVLESGDPYAAKIFAEYKKSVMPAQQITDEEINAIFEYVENPPVVEKAKTEGVSQEDVDTTDYETNRKYFWALVMLGIVILMAILGVGNALKSLLASSYYKTKLKEKEQNDAEDAEDAKNSGTIVKAIAVIIGTSLLVPFSSFAGETEVVDNSWPMVTNGEIWSLLTIDLVLLGILFYIGGMFKSVMMSIKTQKEIERIEKIKAAKPDITKLLTDTVDIEDEASILMDHDYDGIQELDNNLPPWWKWGFYISIVFAFVYFTYYHVLGGDLQEAEYNKEMAIAEIAKQAYLEKSAMNIDETNVTMVVESAGLSEGSAIFQKNCAICHKADGSGEVGPNLTDNAWIYGYDIKNVFKTVSKGTSGGMEPWSRKLNPVQIQQVSSYLLTMPEVPGKAAQGEIIEQLEVEEPIVDSLKQDNDTIN
jgi:cytochrome c oxidase cbb3-type subunit 3